jgi:cytochrome c
MFRSVIVGGLLLVASCAWVFPPDVTAGEKAFKLQCGTCHSAAAGRNAIGPTLFGVVGRKAGTVAGFAYSATNKNSGLTWDEATLDRYLSSPKAVVWSNKMTYAGIRNDTQRADVIAYLATLH